MFARRDSAATDYKPKKDPRKTLLFHIACIRTVTIMFPEKRYNKDQISPKTLRGNMACVDRKNQEGFQQGAYREGGGAGRG